MEREDGESYESPKLVRYGDLESVTDGMQGSGVDMGYNRGMGGGGPPPMSRNRRTWF